MAAESAQALMLKSFARPSLVAAKAAMCAALEQAPLTPITDEAGGAKRRTAMDDLARKIDLTDAAIAPVRSRIHALRTACALQSQLLLEPAADHLASLRRIVGAWEERERLRIEAAQAADRNAARARVLADKAADVEPQTADLVEAAGAHQVKPAKKGRRTWLLEVDKSNLLLIRDALLAIPADAPEAVRSLRGCLVVHEPSLRKALANENGDWLAGQAGIERQVTIRSEDRASRSRS